MSKDIRAGVLLTLKDLFSPAIRNAGAEAGRFGSSVSAGLGKIQQAASGVAGKLAGLGVSLGIAGTIHELVRYGAVVERLGTSFNLTAVETDDLKKKIFEVSQQSDIKVNYASLTEALGQVAEMTGDMDFATNNMRTLALALQATGASGASIGGMASEFQKAGISGQDLLSTMGTLVQQGKEGAFTAANFASLGPRIMSAYLATGRSGATAFTEANAALQVFRRGTGSSEQAATAFEAVMRNLTDPTKQKELKKMGVSVRDLSGDFKPVTTLVAEIVTKAKGSPELLGKIFDAEAMRAFNSSMAEFKSSGSVNSFEKFLKIQDDGSALIADSARNAKTLQANFQNLQGAFVRFGDQHLTAPLGALADVLNKLTADPQGLQNVFTTIAVGLGAIVAVKGLVAVTTLLSNIKNMKGGVASKSSHPQGTLSSGATAVVVTNWPASLGGSTASPSSVVSGESAKPSSPKESKRGNWKAGMKGALASGGVMAAMNVITAVPSIVNTVSDSSLSDREKAKGVGGDVGGLVGGLAGATGGAVIGGAVGSVVPVVGTIVGALAGGVLGLFGSWLGSEAGKSIADSFVTKEKIVPGQSLDSLIAKSKLDSQLPSGKESPLNGKVVFEGKAVLEDKRTTFQLAPVKTSLPYWEANTGSSTVVRGHS